MTEATTLSGLALLGKTAAALLFILAVIGAVAWLANRFQLQRRLGGTGRRLRLVSSIAVGQREKVAIVEVEGTWLVLGVGGGNVRKLHSLDAPEEAPPAPREQAGEGESFASRFATALRQNLRASSSRGEADGDSK